LQQILGLLQKVGSPVQAYGSLLVGPVHTGLSGAGTLDATGAIGVRIDLTTIPSQIGRELTNPETYFDVGWVTSLTTQGPTAGERIRHATQVVFLDPTAQQLEYFLAPGVVATMTLLDGGP
jgi:hypothetical protein